MTRCPFCLNKLCMCQAGMFDPKLTAITESFLAVSAPPFPTPEHLLPKARNSDPDTSHEAAKSMTDEAATQRRQILEHLEAHGPQTADALDEALSFRLTSAGRRMSELLRKALVRRTGEKEMTRSGRRADLWAYRR